MPKRPSRAAHKKFWLDYLKKEAESRYYPSSSVYSMWEYQPADKPIVDKKALDALYRDPFLRAGLMWQLIGRDGLSITILCHLTGRKCRKRLVKLLCSRGLMHVVYCSSTNLNVWITEAVSGNVFRSSIEWCGAYKDQSYPFEDGGWDVDLDSWRWELEQESPSEMSSEEARKFSHRCDSTIPKKDWALLKAAVAAGARK